MRSEVALQSQYARAAAPSHKSSEARLPTLSRTSRGGEENNDAHQCGTAPGQKGPMSSCLWRVDLPTKGSYRLTYSTSFFHILRETETRNGNINGTWQQVVSAGKGFPRTWHRCLGAIPRQPYLSSPFTPMLVCLYLGPTTVSLRGLSKRKGEVELWTRWSFQTSASASLEFLLTILDSIQTAAACHWTTREPQRSKRTPGGGAARASGGFAEAA